LTHLEEVFRAEYGRTVAAPVRRFGDIDIAEDALADALVTALERWPRDGVPPNPAAWLTRVAGNKAIDRLRREKVRDTKRAEVAMHNDDTLPNPQERWRTTGSGSSSPAATQAWHLRTGSR
jgi:RNA polymerase sigma-70 factor, ECF subfamily